MKKNSFDSLFCDEELSNFVNQPDKLVQRYHIPINPELSEGETPREYSIDSLDDRIFQGGIIPIIPRQPTHQIPISTMERTTIRSDHQRSPPRPTRQPLQIRETESNSGCKVSGSNTGSSPKRARNWIGTLNNPDGNPGDIIYKWYESGKIKWIIG